MTPRSPADVAVIGAGAAGLACASRLAELGRRVIVFESRSVLGGRASSWVDPRVGIEIDNGPHLLAGAYREFFGYLARVGAPHGWTDPGRLRVPLWSGTSRHVLRWRGGPGRLGLAAGFATFGALSWSDRRRALSVVSAEVTEDRPLAAFLDAHGQSAEARRWLWHPLARAVFNEEPAILSARLFAVVLRRLFGDGAAAAVLHRPTLGLSALHADPAARYVAAHGGEVRHPCAVSAVRAEGSEFAIEGARGPLRARAVCLAVPAETAAHIWTAPLPGLAAAYRVPHAPLVTAHLWLEGDAPALAEPFAGLVDADFSWAFDLGTRAIDGHAARHVALVAPGSRELAEEQAHRVARRARQTLEAFAPVAARGLLDARVVKEPHAAPSLTPEVVAERPPVETAVPGLALAGDWTATGLPATLEGAAWSGHRAAEVLDRRLTMVG